MIFQLLILLWLLAALTIYLLARRSVKAMRMFTVACTAGLLLLHALIMAIGFMSDPMVLFFNNQTSIPMTPYILSNPGHAYASITRGNTLKPDASKSQTLETDGVRMLWLVAADGQGKLYDLKVVKPSGTGVVLHRIEGRTMELSVQTDRIKDQINHFNFRHMLISTLTIINMGIIILLATGTEFLRRIFPRSK